MNAATVMANKQAANLLENLKLASRFGYRSVEELGELS
jgi:hypothetical protein